MEKRLKARPSWGSWWALTLVLAMAAPAFGVDGVIEINQARAKAGGVAPSDTPLFPVTLDQPGSYRLTGNLDVTDASARPAGTAAENTTAILVTADNVTIDLNGFMIKGPTVCSGVPLTCSPTGSGVGIDALGQPGVAVVNGTVRGMGSHGVRIAEQGEAEKVRALSNGDTGIAGGAGTVANCTSSGNGGNGISGTTVTGCTALNNGGVGIGAITVANCTTTGNLLGGIGANTVTGCTASGNGAPQISAFGIAGHNICGPANTPCP